MTRRQMRAPHTVYNDSMIEGKAACHKMPCMQVKLMTQYVRDVKFAEFVKIPDPYFGGAKGFELVRRHHDTPNHASSLTLLTLMPGRRL